MDKTYLKNTVISIITSLLSLFFIFYIINQVNIIGRDEVTLQYASVDSATDTLRLEGNLCFYDTVVNAPEGYSFVPLVDSGTGVEKNNGICQLYSKDHQDTVEVIARIDRMIAYLEKCSDVRGGSLDKTDYDKQVKDSYSRLVDMLYSGNLASGCDAGRDWLVAKSRRNVSIGIISGYSQQISALKGQRQSLIEGIGYSSGQVLAPGAGIYYSFADGYEEIFGAELAEKGSYKDFENALSAVVNKNSGENPVGKLVTSSKWYTVCRVSNQVAQTMKAGNSYAASFAENGKRVWLKLERTVTEYKSDSVMLVFSCDTNLSDFIEYRYMTLDLDVGSYSGLGVPCSAVRYVDGQVGVYIVEGNKARFRKINIVGESGGRYIVTRYASDSEEYASHLKLYDSIITSGKNVYDGRYVELA